MEAPRETAVSALWSFSNGLRLIELVSQIVTAVNFLNNPKIARSTLFQKRNFLASKGLTDEEIQRAFEKAGIFVKMSDIAENGDDTRIQIPPPTTNYNRQMTTFERIKDVISSAALISGIAYGIWCFYKVKVQCFAEKNIFLNFDPSFFGV